MRIDARRGSAFVMLGGAAFLAGCTSLSGVGGDAHYACPAPAGVQCGSVSANYQQSLHREPPTQAPSSRSEAIADTVTTTTARLANADAPFATPSYSPPRILTLWVAPWTDRDNVLHGGAVVHVPIDHGHWLIGQARPPTPLASRALRPPRAATSAAPANTGDEVDPGAAPPRRTSPPQTKDDDAP
jgi:conjugal transfer pilus assembly protein TraV